MAHSRAADAEARTVNRVSHAERATLDAWLLIANPLCCWLPLHNAHCQVETIADYDLYCHYVAGLVGIGLSQLFGKC